MQTESPILTAQELKLLDSVIFAATRTRRMRFEDAEDFRQSVHLRLAERGGDIFTRFKGQSSLRTFLRVVVERMLLDWQNHTYGKWRPSAVAARHGSIAITLDRLISRDRFPVEQAIEHIRSAHPHVDPLELRKLAAALPQRCRRELVPWHTTTVVASAVGFEDPLESAHREQEMCVRRTALARALATLTRDERRLIWLRYRRRLTVRDVAGQIGADPKPLYQRFDRILLALRRRLLKEGITSASTLERRASGSAGDRVRIHPLLTDTIVVAAE